MIAGLASASSGGWCGYEESALRWCSKNLCASSTVGLSARGCSDIEFITLSKSSLRNGSISAFSTLFSIQTVSWVGFLATEFLSSPMYFGKIVSTKCTRGPGVPRSSSECFSIYSNIEPAASQTSIPSNFLTNSCRARTSGSTPDRSAMKFSVSLVMKDNA